MTRLAVRAGIPLVYVNRMPADKQLPPRVSFVGSDDAQSGTLQMAEVCRLLQGKGDIVILVGELTNQAARQRTQDIYDVIARPPCRGIRVLEKQSANWKRTEAADLMTNWLSTGLRPQAVIANDDEIDRKSTRLNSSHSQISYAVFCLKKKKEYIAEDFTIAVLATHVDNNRRACIHMIQLEDKPLQLIRSSLFDSALMYMYCVSDMQT